MKTRFTRTSLDHSPGKSSNTDSSRWERANSNEYEAQNDEYADLLRVGGNALSFVSQMCNSWEEACPRGRVHVSPATQTRSLSFRREGTSPAGCTQKKGLGWGWGWVVSRYPFIRQFPSHDIISQIPFVVNTKLGAIGCAHQAESDHTIRTRRKAPKRMWEWPSTPSKRHEIFLEWGPLAL